MGRAKSGVNKVKKLFSLYRVTAQMIEDYSEELHIPQSQVVEEMLFLGLSGFRKKYRLDAVQKRSLAKESTEESDREKAFEKARKEKWRKIFFDYEHAEKYGWQETGK